MSNHELNSIEEERKIILANIQYEQARLQELNTRRENIIMSE